MKAIFIIAGAGLTFIVGLVAFALYMLDYACYPKDNIIQRVKRK